MKEYTVKVHDNGDREWYLNGKLLTEAEHAEQTAPAVEMTVEEICKELGAELGVSMASFINKIKVVK